MAIYTFQLCQVRRKAHYYNTNFGCTLVAIYTFFAALFWKEEGTVYNTNSRFFYFPTVQKKRREEKSSSLELISNYNKKRHLLLLHFCYCNSVRFKEFATFLPAILSTLFGWPVTVRNFPTPCKIQGNCNPFFSPTFLTTRFKGICNFLAHNSQLVQARAHAVREPIPSYPRQTQSPRESSTELLRWDGSYLMMTSVHSLQLLLHHLLVSETWKPQTSCMAQCH